jgi:hypothetical protein
MITFSNSFTSKFIQYLFNPKTKIKFFKIYRVDAYEFGKLKETSGLKVDFHGFLTMLIKLINQAIEDEKQF